MIPQPHFFFGFFFGRCCWSAPPFESHGRVCLEKAALRGWVLIAAGRCAVLMCHLIRSRCLPRHFIHRPVGDSALVHYGGATGVSAHPSPAPLPNPHRLPGPQAPDVMCDLAAGSAFVPAWPPFCTLNPLLLCPSVSLLLQVTGVSSHI